MLARSFVITILLGACCTLRAQVDTGVRSLKDVPVKYLDAVSSKAAKYSSQINAKTEKTLEKLARWEEKIKAILEKTSPETAQRLFGNDQLTFRALLGQYKNKKEMTDGYRGQYNEYRDKLTTSLKYLEQQKTNLDSTALAPLRKAKEKVNELNDKVARTDEMEKFIKERKKQLMEQALQHIGKSKYLQKISKESYYYVETLQNYKELFSDPKEVEQKALELLGKTKFFNDFMRKNSMLASLFRMPGDDPNGSASLAGLQTRAQVNELISQQIAAGGPGAADQLRQNLQSAQSQLNELKNKVLKAGGSSSDMNMPDNFKPNAQKSKTFLQRLEYGANVQTQKSNGFFPVTSDLGLSLGYKLNDKSVIGVGASYKMGWGRGLNDISITHQGLGLRSYVDVKIKGSFWISGGYEQNYRSAFSNFTQLQDRNAWQQSGLLGVSKVISLKTKFFKKTSLKLLWDFLSYQQVPRTQAVLFRVGYNF